MKQENVKKLTVLGALIAIVSLGISACTAVETHYWNQKIQTLKMKKEWNTILRAKTQNVRKTFSENILTGESISRNVAYDIVHCKTEEDFELNEELIFMFNHFEYISTGYDIGVVSQDIIDKAYRKSMIRYYVIFLPYLDEIKVSFEHDPWELNTQLVLQWEPSLKKDVRLTVIDQN